MGHDPSSRISSPRIVSESAKRAASASGNWSRPPPPPTLRTRTRVVAECFGALTPSVISSPREKPFPPLAIPLSALIAPPSRFLAPRKRDPLDAFRSDFLYPREQSLFRVYLSIKRVYEEFQSRGFNLSLAHARVATIKILKLPGHYVYVITSADE